MMIVRVDGTHLLTSKGTGQQSLLLLRAHFVLSITGLKMEPFAVLSLKPPSLPFLVSGEKIGCRVGYRCRGKLQSRGSSRFDLPAPPRLRQ